MLIELVTANPRTTVLKLCATYLERTGQDVQESTMLATLVRLGFERRSMWARVAEPRANAQPTRKMTPEAERALDDLVAEQPELKLEDARTALEKRFGEKFWPMTVSRALHRLGFARQTTWVRPA